MHQGTIYQYNQRAEVVVPTRSGTTYYGADNHKPLVAYRGLNIDYDLYVKNSDRKPQSLHNKTYTADIIDRTSLSVVLTKTLVPHDYDNGLLLLKLDHEETSLLDAKLYDIQITFQSTGGIGSYAGTSDQNSRLTFVLEVRDGAVRFRPSETVSVFNTVGDDYYGSRMAGPPQTANKTGLQTLQVYTNNYTGTYKVQATMSLNPLSGDWFDVTGQSYTVTADTGPNYHTFNGMYYWVRFVHTPDVSNVGTLDKIIYRS